jgi:tellurite resistance protein TehA-like permease
MIVSGVLAGIAAVTVQRPGLRILVAAVIVLGTWALLMAMGLDPAQNPDKGAAVVAWAVTFVLVASILSIVKARRAVHKKFPELWTKQSKRRR